MIRKRQGEAERGEVSTPRGVHSEPSAVAINNPHLYMQKDNAVDKSQVRQVRESAIWARPYPSGGRTRYGRPC